MNNIVSQLFERTSDNNQFCNYVRKIQKKINYQNFTKLFLWNKNFGYANDFYHYERYVFMLLKIWMMKHEAYTQKYILNLKRLITKYQLWKRLTIFELEYINIFEEIVFNKERNLKNIVVDFPTTSSGFQNEEIFYIFHNVKFEDQNSHYEGEVFFTNTRIVLSYHTRILSVPFKDIEKYKLTKKGIEIIAYEKMLHFEPKNDDPRVFYVSFERIYYGNSKRKNFKQN